MAMSLKCPKCKVPMTLLNTTPKVYKCGVCNFEVETEEQSEEKTQAKSVSVDDLNNALERAKHILTSPMSRKINITASIGGIWAKRFFACQTLLGEGLKVDREQVIANILKSGINDMFAMFSNAASFKEASLKMVAQGVLKKETAELMFRDMSNVETKLDEWKIDGEEEEVL